MIPAHLRYAPMYRVTQKSVSCGHPRLPSGPPPVCTSVDNCDRADHLCTMDYSCRLDADMYIRRRERSCRERHGWIRRRERGCREEQGCIRRHERVSAGHRFLRNPVHRSVAEMCRESEIEKAEMSAGHRFTILNCIYHNDNPS